MEGGAEDEVAKAFVVTVPPKTDGGAMAVCTFAAACWYACSVCDPDGFTTPDMPERQCERVFCYSGV